MATYREVHCWEDMAEETGEFDGNGPVTLTYTCLRLQGHDGLHEFTLDSEIAIRFTDAGGVDGRYTLAIG